ncbi:MAG: phosphatidylglycerophosphatase A [Pirellulales bacterium]
MTSPSPQPPHPSPKSLAVWLATGVGIGLIAPAPGTVATALWGMPLAWAIGRLPSIGWQILAIAVLIAVGIPLCTAAGRALGGKKDNQAIVWDEIVTVPIVFLLVPFSSWTIALIGFALHRLLDITKPPPARQLERLPDGLGVMADDVMASVYACLAFAILSWLLHAARLTL